MTTTLVRGGMVVGPDMVVRPADVLIEDKLFSRVLQPETHAVADRVIEAAGSLVMPGLVNAHSHSETSVQRGMTDPTPLEMWLPLVVPFVSTVQFDAELVRLAALAGAVHMLKRGVTTVVDHWAAPIDLEEGLEAVTDAYEAAGIRAVVGVDFSDVPLHEEIPALASMLPLALRERLNESVPSASNYLDVCKGLAARMGDKSRRVHAMLGISAPQRCSSDLLSQLADLSADSGMAMHSHLLETRLQRWVGSQRHAKGLVGLLDDAGWLSQRLSVAHAIYVSDDEAALLGERGVSVVHCPVSNLKLGSGVMPLRRLLRSGVAIGLGSDGASSNDDLNLFQVAKFAALVHTIDEQDSANWPTAVEAFGWATKGGATAAGLGETTGSIEEGQCADLLLLNLHSSTFRPLNDPVRQAVFAEDGRDVTTVLVDGQIVVEGGECVSIRESRLLDELADRADRYHAAWDTFRRDAQPILSAVNRLYRESSTEWLGPGQQDERRDV